MEPDHGLQRGGLPQGTMDELAASWMVLCFGLSDPAPGEARKSRQ
jgi:hypothetical protein